MDYKDLIGLNLHETRKFNLSSFKEDGFHFVFNKHMTIICIFNHNTEAFITKDEKIKCNKLKNRNVLRINNLNYYYSPDLESYMPDTGGFNDFSGKILTEALLRKG